MRKSLGLTLIELLITIAIVAVISAIGYATYDNAQKKARDSKRKNDLRDIQVALQLYYQDTGYYPNSTTGSAFTKKSTDTGASGWDSVLSTSYIKQMPKDPKNTATTNRFYRYDTPAGHLTFIISTNLENDSDPQRVVDCNSNITAASAADKHDYCVTEP